MQTHKSQSHRELPRTDNVQIITLSGGSADNCDTSSSVRHTDTAAAFSWRRATVFVPTSGMMSLPCASSHAKLICDAVQPLERAMALTAEMRVELAVMFSSECRGTFEELNGKAVVSACVRYTTCRQSLGCSSLTFKPASKPRARGE